MPILKLTPSCKDYLWGGSRLRTGFGVHSDLQPLAEAWVLSCHPEGPSFLPDGSTLQQYIDGHPGCLGTACHRFQEFPILAKLIDAADNLSIQVHPDDAYALAHEGQYGKTEMWYVLDCEPGATLYYGFRHKIDREEFARRIRDNTLTEVLNAGPIHPGDCFFIPAGTLHAIGRGIVVAEIQQNSNVTYRVCDYGRLGEQLTLNQWVLGSSPRWCTKNTATSVAVFFYAPSPSGRAHASRKRLHSPRGDRSLKTFHWNVFLTLPLMVHQRQPYTMCRAVFLLLPCMIFKVKLFCGGSRWGRSHRSF